MATVRRPSLEQENLRWTYSKAHTFYVVILPVTLGLPVLRLFSLPCKDAHIVLNHHIFDYPVTQTANAIRGAKTR
jgi:hypothetical protein